MVTEYGIEQYVAMPCCLVSVAYCSTPYSVTIPSWRLAALGAARGMVPGFLCDSPIIPTTRIMPPCWSKHLLLSTDSTATTSYASIRRLRIRLA